MTNELSRDLVCVCMRNGVQVWIERDRGRALIAALSGPNAPQFIECDGNMLNRADITGIFNAPVMEETTRRKNGEWQCDRGVWHNRNQKCGCDRRRVSEEERVVWKEHGFEPLP